MSSKTIHYRGLKYHVTASQGCISAFSLVVSQRDKRPVGRPPDSSPPAAHRATTHTHTHHVKERSAGAVPNTRPVLTRARSRTYKVHKVHARTHPWTHAFPAVCQRSAAQTSPAPAASLLNAAHRLLQGTHSVDSTLVRWLSSHELSAMCSCAVDLWQV